MNQNRQPPRQNQGYVPAQGQTNGAQGPFNRPTQQPLQSYNNQPMQNNVRQFDHGRQNPNAGYEQSQHQGQQYPAQGQHQGQQYPEQGQNQGQQYQEQSYNPNNKMAKDDKRVSNRPDWFLQLNCYGGKCAFQLETSQTKDLWFTVTMESAEREDPKDPQNKRYQWANKTILQMTKNELPIFIAVMLGLLPSARFDNHDTKFFEVINQDKSFFFKSGGQNRALHVAPISTIDAYLFGTAALTQYCRNFHGLSCEAGLQIISRLAAQLAACGGYKPAGKG